MGPTRVPGGGYGSDDGSTSAGGGASACGPAATARLRAAAASRASREARLDMVVACEQSLGREPPENRKNKQIVLVSWLKRARMSGRGGGDV